MSFASTVFAVFAPGAVAHRAYAFSLCLTQLNQLPEMPGRSDTARSKDLAELKSLLEEKSSKYAELLKQHEFSLARYAAFHGCICNPFQAHASLNHEYPHALDLWSACLCLCIIGILDLQLPMHLLRSKSCLKGIFDMQGDLSERSKQLQKMHTRRFSSQRRSMLIY